jgi:hypothetical protein
MCNAPWLTGGEPAAFGRYGVAALFGKKKIEIGNESFSVFIPLPGGQPLQSISWALPQRSHYMAQPADSHLAQLYGLNYSFPACVTPPPPVAPSCPQDATDGNLVISTFQSSHVDEVSGRPAHLTRT